MFNDSSDVFVQRALLVTSVIVGLIAWDAWQYRRQLLAFARFTSLWNRPADATNDRSYRQAKEAISADHV